jgi:hypothetical protein
MCAINAISRMVGVRRKIIKFVNKTAKLIIVSFVLQYFTMYLAMFVISVHLTHMNFLS